MVLASWPSNAYSASSSFTPGHAQLAAAPFMRESKLEDLETETLLTLVMEKDVPSQRKEVGLTAVAYHTALGLFWGSRNELPLGVCNSSTEDIKKNHCPSPSLGFGPLSFHNSEVIRCISMDRFQERR